MGPSAASVLRSLMKMTTRVDGATVIMWVVQIKRQMKLLLVALALAVPLAEAADRCGGCKTLVDQFKSVRTRSTADSSRPRMLKFIVHPCIFKKNETRRVPLPPSVSSLPFSLVKITTK